MTYLEKEAITFAQVNKNLLALLNKKVIFITGANGLIGKTLIHLFLAYNKLFKTHIKIVAAIHSFNDDKNKDNIKLYKYELNKAITYRGKVDYIIHTAALTSSAAFVDKAIDVLLTSCLGGKHILDFAQKKKVKGIILLSSMEVYGLGSNKPLKENFVGNFSPLEIRYSYPEGKRYLEALSTAYFKQKQVPIFIARLAQCFGPGVKENDERFFALLTRHLLLKKDFTLLTDGNSKRCYIYTFDAAIALITILLKGKEGEVYNVANVATYISIKDLCLKMIKEFKSPIKLLFVENNKEKVKYLPTHNLLLDTSKLLALGFVPVKDLKEMFTSLLQYWSELH